MSTEESKQQARVALAAKALEESVPSVRHVFSIDGKIFLTWEDVEKAVSVTLGVARPGWTNIAKSWRAHFEPAGNTVFSCYGIQHNDDVYPLGVNRLFAVAEWSDGAIKWTLAPPGANEPVFTKGKLSGWF